MHIKSSGQRTTSSMAIDRTCPCVSPVSRWGSDDEARAGDETYLAMYLADDSLGEELHMYMYMGVCVCVNWTALHVAQTIYI